MNPIPQAPGKLPVLGHALQLLRDPLAFLSSLPACGDLVRVKLGPVAAVVVCDPELTRQVLVDDRTYNIGGPLFDRVQEAVGNSVTKSTTQHVQQRRLVQPAFSPARLPGYAQQMTTHLEEMTDSWRDGQTLDIMAEMQAVTTKSALAAMFSQALSPGALQQATEDLVTIFAGFYRRAVTPPWLSRLPAPGNTRYHRAIARLRGAVSAIIAERRDGGGDHGDLLSALLATDDSPLAAAAGSGGQGLTDDEITDVVMAFFIAGVQTTANLLAWALHLIATHPDMQARLSAEADAILAGAPVSFEHISGLRLHAEVITETLRLYPPGWLLTRTVATSTQLGGYLIPAGTALFYSPYIIHHRSDLYPEPRTVRPRPLGPGPAAAEARLHRLRARPAQVHRGRVRPHRGHPRAGGHHQPLAPRTRPGRAGQARGRVRAAAAAAAPARHRPSVCARTSPRRSRDRRRRPK